MRDDITLNPLAEAKADDIQAQLETIFDPEIGLDIYNLGLIYEIHLDEAGLCQVTLTFTGVACACIETVPVELKEKLVTIPGIDEVKVNVVWSPVWNMTRISRLGRMTLGINPN
ncbi:aromatic ring hydroxylase [Suicoccus acidiformans]|uniref:Aromatic ring hydroxylase n=1 Tax=Suicoccus acidiformans TaxID=2036206 RepID=A0A347WLU7_9LACT|nr:metal-sulfur cluster assembly factor [Suicoccus acidiformans]AXY26054.1 aromatic ring hydroxylase [Suicoccus acidiformans]